MSTTQKLGIALLLAAFVGAKLFVLFSKPTGIGVAALGAVLLVFSESEAAQ
jgi:hypothetical protein